MVRCVNSSCHKEIEDRFNFCPYCGKDNRPPHVREPVPCMKHEGVQGGWACGLCGSVIDPNHVGPESSSKKLWGFALFGLGLCVVIIGVLGRFLIGHHHARINRYDAVDLIAFVVGLVGGYMMIHGYCWMKGKTSDYGILDGEISRARHTGYGSSRGSLFDHIYDLFR